MAARRTRARRAGERAPASTGQQAGLTWPPGFLAAAAVTFELDGEAAVLARDPSATERLGLLSHGAYGPRTGLPRLLGLLAERDLRATFFASGFAARRWPEAVLSIREAGHELALHGELAGPGGAAVDSKAEEAAILRGLEALEAVAGVHPAGYRAGGWGATYATPHLLARHGFGYDSSLMDADLPYLLATDRGPGTAPLVEIPSSWDLDDRLQYGFLPGHDGLLTVDGPGKVLELWRRELEESAAEGVCFVLTAHPALSGRPARAHAVARLLDEMLALRDAGLWIATLAEIAEHVCGQPLEPVRHERPSPAED